MWRKNDGFDRIFDARARQEHEEDDDIRHPYYLITYELSACKSKIVNERIT